MENYSINEEDQVAWNLSSILIQQIGILIIRGSTYYTKGNLIKCFFDFQEIKTLIHADLDPNEKKHLDKLENILFKYRKEIKINNNFNKYLRKYRERILEFLSKYGYLISKKKDSKKII